MIKIQDNFDSMVLTLKAKKANFVIETTNKTKVLKYKGQKFLYQRTENDTFKPSHLGYMAKIRKEVKELLKTNPISKLNKQNYYECRKFADTMDGEYIVFKDCLEVDINKAYFQALFNMGLLSQESFDLFIKLPKNIRLALVGSLATRKNIYFHKEGKMHFHDIKVDNDLRAVFFACVDMVDRALKSFKFLQKDNFLFYWVDGIYLKKNDRIQRDLKIIEARFDFEFSIDECEKIIFLKCSEYQTKIGVRQKGDSKIFNVENLFVL